MSSEEEEEAERRKIFNEEADKLSTWNLASHEELIQKFHEADDIISKRQVLWQADELEMVYLDRLFALADRYMFYEGYRFGKAWKEVLKGREEMKEWAENERKERWKDYGG